MVDVLCFATFPQKIIFLSHIKLTIYNASIQGEGRPFKVQTDLTELGF
jgi:hypothetical protein